MKNNLRKPVTWIFTLVMLFTMLQCFGTAAFAEESNEASVTIDGVTTEYATLEEALTKVYFKTATISLLKDVTVEESIDLYSNEVLLIQGNGYTITGTSSENIFYVQKADLTLDDVTVLFESENGSEAVTVFVEGKLTLQNGTDIESRSGRCITNIGKLTVTSGSVVTMSQNHHAILSDNGTVFLEAEEGRLINISSEDEYGFWLNGGSLTMSGYINIDKLWVDSSYGGPMGEVFLSGALNGLEIPVFYNIYLGQEDQAMIAPAEGYTITSFDAEKITFLMNDYISELGEDGWIWAKYAHVHAPVDGNYLPGAEGTHSFICSCSQSVTEDCSQYFYYYDEREHSLLCSRCYAPDSSSVGPHTMNGCECECGYDTHKVDNYLISSEDDRMHTGTCTLCDELIIEIHNNAWCWDETNHWWGCSDYCGYMLEGTPHEEPVWYPDAGINHYSTCSCGYSLVGKDVDDDGDGICDLCGDGMCYDSDGDHNCDDCGWKVENLCEDAEGDHVCDVCHQEMNWNCVDEDGNHICDTELCGRSMTELCVDEDNNFFCDSCGQDLCSHYFEDFTINDDNTHTGTCSYCKRTVTEECDRSYGYGWNDTEHWDLCYCGRKYDAEAHDNSSLLTVSFVHHTTECTKCYETVTEEHRYNDENCCEVCSFEKPEIIYDVYVGGVGLEDGDYLDLDGNVTDTQPEGGYAYYKEGVLQLVDYFYGGEGFYWEETVDGVCAAAIYATTDLILELAGESHLDMSEAVENVSSDGIVAEKDLTVRGDGELTVLAQNDGISTEKGDFTMESGIVNLGIKTYDEETDEWINLEIEDDGLDLSDGDVIIKGGALNINADDHGVDVEGTVTIHGGTVDIEADDDGFNVNDDIIITGGSVSVQADDYGLDSDDGNVIIVGGEVYIETENWAGISVYDNVVIYGGEIVIDAYDAGIHGGHVIIYGGYLEVTSGWYSIFGEEITLHVELPENVFLDGYGSEYWIDTGDLCLDEEDMCIDEYPKDHKCDSCGEKMGDDHAVTDGKHTCGYCGEKVTECDNSGEPVCENEVPATFDGEGSYDMVVYCTVCGEEVSRTTYPIEKLILGDINGDRSVDIADALLLFMHSMLPDNYPIIYTGAVDFNGDESVDVADALYLFMASMLPDKYPL